MTLSTMSSSLATNAWDALWFRENGSAYAGEYNSIYYFIFWASAAFFVVLMVLMVWFMLRYKRRPGVAAEVSASHNTPLEIAWSVIPAIGFAIMFFWGTWAYLPKAVVPEGAETINVTAQQWQWKFEYPNGATSLQTEWISDMEQPLFAIPAGRPVKFLLSSTDVIHSFYIPEFRIKRDCFPNRYTVCWAEAKEPTHWFDPADGLAKPYDKNDDGKFTDGEQGYYLYCAEYCGDQHSQMTHRIAVLAEPDYQAWLEKQNNTDGVPLLDLGAKLYKTGGCAACHSVQPGGVGTGPSWHGIWGTARPGYQPLNADENAGAVVDEQYIRTSIIEPQSYYAPGFQGVQMSQYAGVFTDRELRAIATYIQSLSDDPAAVEKAKQKSDAEAAAQAASDAGAAEGAADESDPEVPAEPGA